MRLDNDMPASRRATGALALAVAGVFGSFAVVGLSFDPASAAEPTSDINQTQPVVNLVADEPGATTSPSSGSAVTGVSTEPGATPGAGDSGAGSSGSPTAGATPTSDPDPGETPPVETTTPPTAEPTTPVETPTPTPEPTEPVQTGGTTPDPGAGEPAAEQPSVDAPIRQEPGAPTGAPEAGGEVGDNIVPVEPGHRGNQDSANGDSGTRPTVKPSPTAGPSSASDVDVSAPTPSATPQADDLANTGVNGNLVAVFSIAAIIVAIGTILLRRRNA